VFRARLLACAASTRAVHGLLERAKALLDFDVELLDEVIQPVEMGELAREQEALVCPELANQRTLQLR